VTTELTQLVLRTSAEGNEHFPGNGNKILVQITFEIEVPKNKNASEVTLHRVA